MRELYTLLIILSLFAINWLLQTYISKYIITVFNVELIGIILDSVVRTSFLSIIGIVIIYKSKISKQVNDIIDKLLSMLKLI